MNDKNLVPILTKALDIIEYINNSPEPVTLPELQKNLNISQPSCYRIVTTLVLYKWLEKRTENHYDISEQLARITAKNGSRLESYKKLQPAMNNLVRKIGFQAKLSVRDGEDFYNVCSAKNLSDPLTFSEPGFRSSLRHIATVSTIFLTEDFSAVQQKMLAGKYLQRFIRLQQQYQSCGYCYNRGTIGKEDESPLDTLSFPVKKAHKLYGVVSFLGLPGSLEQELDRISREIPQPLQLITDLI